MIGFWLECERCKTHSPSAKQNNLSMVRSWSVLLWWEFFIINRTREYACKCLYIACGTFTVLDHLVAKAVNINSWLLLHIILLPQLHKVQIMYGICIVLPLGNRSTSVDFNFNVSRIFCQQFFVHKYDPICVSISLRAQRRQRSATMATPIECMINFYGQDNELPRHSTCFWSLARLCSTENCNMNSSVVVVSLCNYHEFVTAKTSATYNNNNNNVCRTLFHIIFHVHSSAIGCVFCLPR